MSANSFFSSNPTPQVIAYRFWGLLVVILVLAISSSAVAVRLTAMPYLQREQRETVKAQAVQDSLNLTASLAQYRLFLDLISNAPEIVNVAMGYVDNTDIARDYMEALPEVEGLSWIQVHDILSDPIAHYYIVPEDRFTVDKAELHNAIEAWLDGAPGTERRILFQPYEERIHVVISVPVLHEDLVEGVVSAGFNIPRSTVFPPSEMIQRADIMHNTPMQPAVPAHPNATLVEVKGWDLAIALVPDAGRVNAAGSRLLARTIGTLASVLCIAFAVFAALGRTALLTPQKQLAAQRKTLAELAAIAQRANEAFLLTNLKGQVTWANPAFETLSGYTANEIKGLHPAQFLQGPETNQEETNRIRHHLIAQTPIKTELLNYRKDGSSYWVSISLSPLRKEDSECYGFLAISHDITQERAQREAIAAAQAEIEHQALHDPLTNLPNRRALDLALKEQATDSTIVRIDLDHFKYVNDTLGHEAGDFVLTHVADILRDETKSDDLPARVGGDEFVILLGRHSSTADGEQLARRMLARIRKPHMWEGKTIRVGASFGVASTRDALLSKDDLIVGADAALYEAKESGRNTVRLYTPELHSEVLRRRRLAREIRRAIAAEEFVPFYQPQFCAQTLEVVGVETLARWLSPEMGLIAPGVFLPIAKQLSAVEEIDKIIFTKALEEITGLNRTGVNVPKVSFNVTAQRIQNPELFDLLRHRQKDTPHIGFEVLESVLVEEQSDMFNFSLDRLRDNGICIEVDDFGSGHASIVGLMHLRPDVMKIDQRLIMPITHSETTRDLLQQIIGMANILGLKVTAEGVETQEHGRILADMGCHTLQGYAFSRPKPLDELTTFLVDWQNRPADTPKSA